MAKVYAMIADGTEEVECLAVVDLLRRSKIDTVLVAAKEDREVVTSHGIRIQADAAVGEVDFSDADVIFLPGGMPGSVHLSQCEPLIQALKAQNQAGKRATCFPGFEEELNGAIVVDQGVVTDGNITTAKGLGVALDLGLELVKLLIDEKTADDLKKTIQYA